MSLESYQELQQASELMVGLPTLISASLTLTATSSTFAEMVVQVNDLNPSAGWQMYRDETTASTSAPNREDLIEAQYSNGTHSLHVKQQNGVFIVTTFTVDNTPNSDQVFKAQVMQLSNKVKPISEAVYHLWYQRQSDENSPQRGLWQPLAQQFIGFNKEVC
ncbi:hypothetical protein [Alkalimarinus sediminis]|uniref:Uncharacterized protein n=1 Tax=Alkalimarinus sediminis TaxID=1632866 RepID=A0A9E8HNM9_9ALTE|nr:hypothetical protein [Alkalimarinus sediminis]UZW76587.1 hypothetical protein NNL22_08400 [Alkalimarinus sediminis]